MKPITLLAVTGSCLALAGCCCGTPSVPPAETVEAMYTAEPVKIDGVLDDAVWQKAKRYRLTRNPAWGPDWPGEKAEDFNPLESGEVMVAWDDEFLYVAADMEDSDVVVMDTENQQLLFQSGDLVEVFVKPRNRTYYWENYVTPYGNNSSLFIASRSYMSLPSLEQNPIRGLVTAGRTDGTLNTAPDDLSASWSRDKGWQGEMAIPIAELNRYDAKLDGTEPWTIFFGRYNYSLFLPNTELSCYPALESLSYHLTDCYAPLVLVK